MKQVSSFHAQIEERWGCLRVQGGQRRRRAPPGMAALPWDHAATLNVTSSDGCAHQLGLCKPSYIKPGSNEICLCLHCSPLVKAGLNQPNAVCVQSLLNPCSDWLEARHKVLAGTWLGARELFQTPLSLLLMGQFRKSIAHFKQ